MGIYQVPGSGSQIWKRKAWPTSRAGSAQFGQRNLLCGSLWLRVETPAERLWSVANHLWLFSPLEPRLDLDVYSRHLARLRTQDRRTQGGPDSRDYRQPVGQDSRPGGRTRLRRG